MGWNLPARKTPRSVIRSLFMESSSIRLWSTLAQDFPGERVVNLGFGGSTMEACASFFERLVVPYSPRALVLYAGDNDLGDGKRPEAVEGYYQTLSDKVRRYLGPIPFAYISIKASPARHYLIDSIIRDERANPSGTSLSAGPYLHRCCSA